METVGQTLDVGGRKLYSAERFRVEVGDLAWRPGPLGVRYVTGNLVNHSAVELCWVKVELELYDDSADLLGVASDHFRRLAPGRIWPFKVLVLKASASRSLLFDVTCEYGSIYSPGDCFGPAGAVWHPTMAETVSPEHHAWAIAQE